MQFTPGSPWQGWQEPQHQLASGPTRSADDHALGLSRSGGSHCSPDFVTKLRPPLCSVTYQMQLVGKPQATLNSHSQHVGAKEILQHKCQYISSCPTRGKRHWSDSARPSQVWSCLEPEGGGDGAGEQVWGRLSRWEELGWDTGACVFGVLGGCIWRSSGRWKERSS